jgi:hypothetical protein
MRHSDATLTSTHTPPAAESGASPKPFGRQVAKGVIGFGLIASGFALTPVAGPASLALAVPGFVALGGCPTCWIYDMAETVSAGRLKRTCTDEGCELHTARPN